MKKTHIQSFIIAAAALLITAAGAFAGGPRGHGHHGGPGLHGNRPQPGWHQGYHPGDHRGPQGRYHQPRHQLHRPYYSYRHDGHHGHYARPYPLPVAGGFFIGAPILVPGWGFAYYGEASW